MDGLSLSAPHFPAAILAGKHDPTAATATTTALVSFSLKPPPPSTSSHNPVTSSSPLSAHIRRPHKIPKPAQPSSSSNNPKIPSNPLKNLVNPTHIPIPPAPPHSLTTKLRLTSKLSPPPPPPPPTPPPPPPPVETEDEIKENESEHSDSGGIEFREEGKIFVGNLPNWIKKNEVSEFFRQFGPIKNVILIKGHGETERNAGFGFVLYGGTETMAAKSAMKAVEFDGVEFHGRVLTVKLDDGRRLKERSEERARYVGGYDGVEYRSKWHEERESSRRSFRQVLDTEPENWQAVVQSFERVKKVKLANLFIPSVFHK